MRHDEEIDHVDRDASWRLERPGVCGRPGRGRWSVQQRALQLLEPCRAAPSFCEVSIPGDPLARPSVHPRWLRGCCAPMPPAEVTSAWEGPVATHGRLPRPSPLSASLADICIPTVLLNYSSWARHELPSRCAVTIHSGESYSQV